MPLPASADRQRRGDRLRRDLWTTRGEATLLWYFDASEIDDAIEYFAGEFQTIGSVWGGSIVRRVPASHPEYDDLLAMEVDVVERVGNSLDPALFTGALLQVRYGIPPYGPGGDTPFASLRRDFGCRWITVAGRRLRMASDSAVLGQDMAIPFPVVNYQVTVYGQAITNTAAIAAAVAAPVNSATLYLPDGVTAAPGYGLFNGVADEMTFTFGGQVTKATSYRFALTDGIKWTQIVHPVTGNIGEVLLPNGNPVIASSNLNLVMM